jgi:hypothetical protein
MCGNFNLPDIDWSVDNSLNCLSATCSGTFLDMCCNFGLHPLVSSPTRVNNTLDLVLNNGCNCVLAVKVFEPLSTSDHSRVRCDVLHKLPSCRLSHSHSVSNYYRANWEQIKLFSTT